MTDRTFEARLRSYAIIPVVEIEDAGAAVDLGRALVDAGLPVVEVTFRTAQAEESIRRMRAEVPELFVGAGTVLTRQTARSAAGAGAQFLVSPGFNSSVVAEARELGIEIVPGAVTPTEIETAREAGLRLVKFFPAVASGGIEMLAALAGPYGDMSFMPTGGIRADTVAEWLALPTVAACGGTWIAPRDLIASRQFDEVARRARLAAAFSPSTSSHRSNNLNTNKESS